MRRYACPALIALALVATVLAAGCAGSSSEGTPFKPAKNGVLTVATAFLPQPGFWQGNPPTRGFEARLAADLAHRLGLEHVKVVQVPFGDIVAGRLGGADVAISQLTPTREREKVLDFTTPYLAAPPGVLALRGVHASDAKDLRGLHWVVSRLSTLTPILMNRVRPTRPPVQVDDRTQALAVLRRGGADALMLDLPVALGLARAQSQRYEVLGQLDGEDDLAVALPNGSSNTQIVDSAVRRLKADGTIGRLASRWLGDAGQVPLILTQS